MTLAFYKVDNSKHYDRYTFDIIYDRPSLIKDMLYMLKDYELRMYCLDNKLDVLELVEDYNDQILDDGWWCITIDD